MNVPDEILVGGNHLANVLIHRKGPKFSSLWPPTMHIEQVRATIGDEETFDIWCCWSAIMRMNLGHK